MTFDVRSSGFQVRFGQDLVCRYKGLIMNAFVNNLKWFSLLSISEFPRSVIVYDLSVIAYDLSVNLLIVL